MDQCVVLPGGWDLDQEPCFFDLFWVFGFLFCLHSGGVNLGQWVNRQAWCLSGCVFDIRMGQAGYFNRIWDSGEMGSN